MCWDHHEAFNALTFFIRFRPAVRLNLLTFVLLNNGN